MRPNRTFFNSVWGKAVSKGLQAAWQNIVPMLMLEAAMAVLVAIYYFWPLGNAVLARYSTWQQAGGIVLASLATGVAGGVISEFSLVYFQDHGRWSLSHLESMFFKFVIFTINGAVVYEFYAWQAIWFGQGNAWSVIVPKVCVDQFAFSIIWSLPYMTLLTRWHALHYSGKRLRAELNWNFVTERMLPVLVTNWMFWIPGVSIIYSMPLILQTSLFIFATAIWGILLPAVSRLGKTSGETLAQTPVVVHPTALGHPAE